MATLKLKKAGHAPEEQYEPSSTHQHIWLNKKTGFYVWEDETQGFSGKEYATENEAVQALTDYCKFSLDGGIALVAPMLESISGLRDQVFVRKALALLEGNDGGGAIQLLRQNIDRIRQHNDALADFIINKPRRAQ